MDGRRRVRRPITAVVVGSIILVVYAADAVESSSRSTAPDGDWSPVIAWGVGIVLAFLFATVVVPAALIAGLTLSSSTKRWVERPRVR